MLPYDCVDSTSSILLIGENVESVSYYLNGGAAELDAQNEIGGLSPGVYELSYELNEACIVVWESIVIEEIPSLNSNQKQNSIEEPRLRPR